MKAIVSNVSSTVTKIHKNTDCDLVVMGFDGNEAIKYSKELRGETNKLKQLAAYSETIEKTIVSAFDTDNYGIIKHSAGIFDDGKLLGISDMTVSISDSPYMPGAHGKLYDTAAGKFAVAIGDDLFRFELFKSFAICGAESVIVIRKGNLIEINTILLRAYSYLLGLPILLVCKDKSVATTVKGELVVQSENNVFELLPLLEYSIKTTKIKLNK